MQINDLNQRMTSSKLNESLVKNFGYKIQLENFTDAQLEDARNKLRTKISQFEMNESYSTVVENSEYQKTRMFLDVVNQEIFERENCDEVDVEEEQPKKKKQKTDEGYAQSRLRQRAEKLSVPESWINSAIRRISLGESDRRELSAELKTRYDLNESQASWILLEDEEKRADVIIQTRDIVQRITGWLEDVAAMRSEQFLELVDDIKRVAGPEVAQKYDAVVRPAMDSIYTALEQSRQGLNQGLAIVAGDEPEMLGAPIAGETAQVGTAPTGGENLDLGGPEGMPGAGGPEGMPGAEAGPEAGGIPPSDAGRMKRESVEYSRKLGMMLSSKKK
jgi:hypothetical protein